MSAVLPAVILAQCTGAERACELPHGLPWWFTAAFVAVWLTAVWGVFLLLRRRWQRRRRSERVEREPGTDVELW